MLVLHVERVSLNLKHPEEAFPLWMHGLEGIKRTAFTRRRQRRRAARGLRDFKATKEIAFTLRPVHVRR